MFRKYFLPAILLIALMIVINACTINHFQVGSLETVTKNIELGKADTLRAEIRMGVGELRISGGTEDLMQAEFNFNVDELEPDFSFDNSGTEGELLIEHKNTDEFPIGDYDDVRSEWNLQFNEAIPVDMGLTLGAAKSSLDFRGIALTNLNIEMGAGDAEVWLGDNDLRGLDIEMGAGELTIDLTGKWDQDLSGEITAGVGNLVIYLPSEVGVELNVEMGISSLETSGLNKNGSKYTNDAYNKSDVTLRLDIEGGVGRVELEVR
jgi:hypothetical protein